MGMGVGVLGPPVLGPAPPPPPGDGLLPPAGGAGAGDELPPESAGGLHQPGAAPASEPIMVMSAELRPVAQSFFESMVRSPVWKRGAHLKFAARVRGTRCASFNNSRDPRGVDHHSSKNQGRTHPCPWAFPLHARCGSEPADFTPGNSRCYSPSALRHDTLEGSMQLTLSVPGKRLGSAMLTFPVATNSAPRTSNV
jgi:hypothetical protein